MREAAWSIRPFVVGLDPVEGAQERDQERHAEDGGRQPEGGHAAHSVVCAPCAPTWRARADRLDELRAQALEAVRRYAEAATREPEFVPGESSVEVAGRVVEAAELEALVDASLDGWLTEGRFARRFVHEFAATAGRAAAVLTGSGSQANLLAMAAARSHLHERPLQPGDEVITPAVGFPTTVSPIYQQGLVPVYVDVELDTLNPSIEAFSEAVGERTRGIFAAHCLGNPFDAEGLERLCAEHDLILTRGLLRRAGLDGGDNL